MGVRASWPTGGVFLALCALCTPAGVAHASPSYSTTLERSLALPCPPSCLLCHTKPAGGFATANTKLGVTLRQKHGAQCCDDDALISIVQALEASGIDSDGDGVPDVQELREGSDPNLPDAAALWKCEPAGDDAGCSVGHGGGEHEGWWMALGALALVTLPRRVASARRSARGPQRGG